jgi:hypothetical protein
MDKEVGNVLRVVANMPNDMQVEVFRSISSFPAITLPILEMMSNELTGVFESSRGIPAHDPCEIQEQGVGEVVGTVNSACLVRTRAAQRELEGELQSGDEDSSQDEQSEEEASVETRSTSKKRKVRP